MAHIAIDARIINSSTGRYVERLLFYLQELDSENTYTVFVREKDRNYWKPTANNFVVKVAEFDNYSFAEQLGFKRLIDQIRPNLVHFCMPQQPILYRGKTVTTFHDLNLLKTYNSDKNWLIFHIKQLIGRVTFRIIAKKSTQIITISDYTKKDLLRFVPVPGSRVSRIYEASESQSTELEPYELPFEKFIMYVGQQPDYKNIRRLAEAHQNLLKEHPNLGLVLVGKKAKDTLANENFFSKNNYKNIVFTDFIPDSQKDWLLQKCSAYVFPSLMEGFGLPPLEAMTAGAPVVSSNATCLPEVCGGAAHYFNPTDVDDMSRAINDVLTSPELREKLIKSGEKQVRKYSWEKMAHETLEVYQKALED